MNKMELPKESYYIQAIDTALPFLTETMTFDEYCKRYAEHNGVELSKRHRKAIAQNLNLTREDMLVRNHIAYKIAIVSALVEDDMDSNGVDVITIREYILAA